MLSAVGPEAIEPRVARRPRLWRSWSPARVVARVGRALWMQDRALAEVRWAAVTLSAIAILALIAKLLDPADRAFDRAIVLAAPAGLAVGAVGWSRLGTPVVHHPLLRIALGPLAVLLAMQFIALLEVRL